MLLDLHCITNGKLSKDHCKDLDKVADQDRQKKRKFKQKKNLEIPRTGGFTFFNDFFLECSDRMVHKRIANRDSNQEISGKQEKKNGNTKKNIEIIKCD